MQFKPEEMIRRIAIVNEVPLYFLIFPYFINFSIVASNLPLEKLAKIGAFGVVASVIPFALGYFFRYLRLKPLLAILVQEKEKSDPEYRSDSRFYQDSSLDGSGGSKANSLSLQEVKLALLRHPAWEGRVIVIRWTLAIFGFLGFAIPVFDLTINEYLALPVGCIMMIPIVYLAFYFQTEVQLIGILKDPVLAKVPIELSQIKIFSLFQRNLITQIAVVIMPIMTLGFYLVAYYVELIQLPNLWIQFPFIVIWMFAIIIWTSIVGSNSLNKDIENINESIIGLSKGELDRKIPNTSTTNLNKTVQEINEFIKKLDSYFQVIHDQSKKLRQNSETLEKSSVIVFDEINQEQNSIREISDSLQSINSASSQIRDSAKTQSEKTLHLDSELSEVNSEISALSIESKALAEFVHQSVEMGEQVNQEATQTWTKVQHLAKIHGRIKETVGIVEEISDQINLLSLNASIEAARAGEYGRGFAVVASEVSRLADKTRENIDQIKAVVKESEASSRESLESVDQIRISVNRSVDDLRRISTQIHAFSQSSAGNSEKVRAASQTVDELSRAAKRISERIQEQAKIAESIQDALGNITENNDSIVGSSQKLKELSTEINSVSLSLDNSLRIFRV